MPFTDPNRPLDLYPTLAAAGDDGWVVSSAPHVPRTTVMAFDPTMVTQTGTGATVFTLDASPDGAPVAYWGASAHDEASMVTGTMSWTARAPEMVDGAVWALFAYQADPRDDPWLEFDFEWVGSDTTQVHLGIKMEDAAGTLHSLATPSIVDLGFDAADGFHVYDIVLMGDGVAFRADGEVLAYFSAYDMQGRIWTTGEVESHIELWATDDRHDVWAGALDPLTAPLKASVRGASTRPGDLGGDLPRLGTDRGDRISGTATRDVIDGSGGTDRLDGKAGDDRVQGGEGSDVIWLDAGDDWLDGGRGTDRIRVAGATDVTIDLSLTTAQHSGLGRDDLRGFEDVTSGAGDDLLRGSAGANVLSGQAGDDTLYGMKGADRLIGGAGQDHMLGGADADRDVFVFQTLSDSGTGPASRDRIDNFVHGTDMIDLRGLDADSRTSGNQEFAWSQGAAANSVWSVANGNGRLLLCDVDGDGRSDFEVQVGGASALRSSDLYL